MNLSLVASGLLELKFADESLGGATRHLCSVKCPFLNPDKEIPDTWRQSAC